jgi:membrane-bound lytic murein transglycosylase A
MGEAPDDGTVLRPVAFSELEGWDTDDHAAALAAFVRGAAVLGEHPPKRRAHGLDAAALIAIIRSAADQPSADARAFFERNFVPHAVEPALGRGFFTGYYEPVVRGSLTKTDIFTVPLLRMPDDLVELRPGDYAPGLDPSFRFARKTAGGFGEYADRGAIQAGALDGRGLELCWLADPVDAFFIHIQGAARILLTDGRTLRVTYAAKTGHPYTPIGRVLTLRGALAPGAATMQTIRAWLAAHPAEQAEVFAANRSYIFFREAPVAEADAALGPIAAAKVPLTAGRSLAVDRTRHSFHAPVWIETTLPDGAPFGRLMVAQDTGSAIVGPARGDIFFGSGDAAGEVAGGMKSEGRFVLFLPRELAR